MKHKISELEFISLMASLMALSALSIDALLPGLNAIGLSIGISDPKDNQLLVSMIFLGLGFGQLITGTLSDSFGRKPILYLGYFIFTLASLLCIFSTNLETMIVGRLLQGIGLSAPRSVSMAIIRDRFSGDYMARIMSFITVVFILAPIVAPSFGKIILDLFGWESIFVSQLIFGFLVIIWFWKRQEETLDSANRKEFKASLLIDGTKEFIKHKSAIFYTLVIGITTAPFLTYLSASQQIFQEQYGLVDEFPYIFSGLAISIGLATFLNGKFVVRFGMLKMATIPTILLVITASVYAITFNDGVNPPITTLIAFLGLVLFSTGFIIGNISSLAMQPVGHIAGIGAAIVGFLSTLITVPLATFIGRSEVSTALPVFMGFAVCGALALIIILAVNSQKIRIALSRKK